MNNLRNDSYVVLDTPIQSWDEYYFNITIQAARRSKCLSRRVGAVLVKDKSVISTGYNGPPRGIPTCDKRWTIDSEFSAKYKNSLVYSIDFNNPRCPRHSLGAKSGEMLDLCLAAHAEENAILNAAWHGISTKGASLYLNCGVPCYRCLIKIINSGIEEIIVIDDGLFFDDNSKYLLNNSNILVRKYNFE